MCKHPLRSVAVYSRVSKILVLRAAQVPRKLIGTDGFQETPIVEVTRAITKHNYLVMDIDDLPRIIKEVRTRFRV